MRALFELPALFGGVSGIHTSSADRNIAVQTSFLQTRADAKAKDIGADLFQKPSFTTIQESNSVHQDQKAESAVGTHGAPGVPWFVQHPQLPDVGVTADITQPALLPKIDLFSPHLFNKTVTDYDAFGRPENETTPWMLAQDKINTEAEIIEPETQDATDVVQNGADVEEAQNVVDEEEANSPAVVTEKQKLRPQADEAAEESEGGLFNSLLEVFGLDKALDTSSEAEVQLEKVNGNPDAGNSE